MLLLFTARTTLVFSFLAINSFDCAGLLRANVEALYLSTTTSALNDR
jgi:hypothetical protein